MSTLFVSSGVTGVSPSVVGGISTSEQVFPSLLGPGFNNGGGSLQSQAVNPAALVIPGAGVYEGKQINIVAAGNVFVHGSSPHVNFVLQNGTSLASGSNTDVCTLASNAALTTNATYPWAFQATLQGDSDSGIVQVVSATMFINGSSAGTITSTDLTGVSFYDAPPTFVFGFLFGTSDATNLAKLMEFSASA